MYFNYHAKVKRLIKTDFSHYEIVKEYHNIKPALVIYFKSHAAMPIRKHKWAEYFELMENL